MWYIGGNEPLCLVVDIFSAKNRSVGAATCLRLVVTTSPARALDLMRRISGMADGVVALLHVGVT